MIKEERNIANIFFPYRSQPPSTHQSQTTQQRDPDLKEGLLIGFNFEGFLFVIVTVVSLDQLPKGQPVSELLGTVIREAKLQAFN